MGSDVTEGVREGGIMSAVWVAAASDVKMMAVLIEFGSKTAAGVETAGDRVGAQARTSAVTIKNEITL